MMIEKDCNLFLCIGIAVKGFFVEKPKVYSWVCAFFVSSFDNGAPLRTLMFIASITLSLSTHSVK